MIDCNVTAMVLAENYLCDKREARSEVLYIGKSHGHMPRSRQKNAMLSRGLCISHIVATRHDFSSSMKA